jgi:hypothetical protein
MTSSFSSSISTASEKPLDANMSEMVAGSSSDVESERSARSTHSRASLASAAAATYLRAKRAASEASTS